MTEMASGSPQAIWYAYVELTHRYAEAADEGRGSAVAELFGTDGVWDGSAFGLALLQGHAAIRQHFEVAEREFASAHLVTNHRLVEVAESGVLARSYAHAILPGSAHVRQIVVRYDDTLAHDGEWRFARRVLGRVASFKHDIKQAGAQR